MEIDDIRIRIEAEIAKTLNSIEEYKDLTKPIAPDVSLGRITRMDAINNKSVNEASLLQAEEKLRSLNRVLDMYGSPEFGRCISCKIQIPYGRILFRPQSLHCVNCAQ